MLPLLLALLTYIRVGSSTIGTDAPKLINYFVAGS